MESIILKVNKENEKKLALIKSDQRVLLLSHCLRPSDSCTAKMSKDGLLCRNDCPNRCVIGRLRILAEKMGYKGVCIAPGGSMALKFVKKNNPEAIVAIACIKELEEGVCTVKELADKEGGDGGKIDMPNIVVIPLLKDGCVDTEVDENEAKRILRL